MNDGASLIEPCTYLGGLVFGIVNIVGNFGAVFCDQAYWQSSVAAKPLQVRVLQINQYDNKRFVWYRNPCN
jgi:hypothetical protein